MLSGQKIRLSIQPGDTGEFGFFISTIKTQLLVPATTSFDSFMSPWQVLVCFDSVGPCSFTLTYPPGSRNIKPDALSQQCNSNDSLWTRTHLSPVLRGAWFTLVKDAHQTQPSPGTGLTNRLFLLILYSHRSCSGFTLHILEWTVSWVCWRDTSGGLLWRQTPAFWQELNSSPGQTFFSYISGTWHPGWHSVWLRFSVCVSGLQGVLFREATASLTSGFHPQSKGQVERANQDLEAVLRYVTVTNPLTWRAHLVWIDYAHDFLTSSVTGLSPFEASLYWPICCWQNN